MGGKLVLIQVYTPRMEILKNFCLKKQLYDTRK